MNTGPPQDESKAFVTTSTGAPPGGGAAGNQDSSSPSPRVDSELPARVAPDCLEDVPDFESLSRAPGSALPGWKSPAARFLALLEMVFISGLFTDAVAMALAAWWLGLPHTEVVRRPAGLLIFLLGSTLFVIGLFVLFQRLPRDVDVRIRIWPERRPFAELLAALASLPVLFATMWLAQWIVYHVAPEAIPAENPLLGLIRTPQDLAIFFVTGVVGGGLREELQRAFIVRRSEVFFWSPWSGLLVWSAVFGLAHASQGPVAIIVTALLGLEFGLLYLWRRNLLVTVTSHALFNVVVLSIYGSSVF